MKTTRAAAAASASVTTPTGSATTGLAARRSPMRRTRGVARRHARTRRRENRCCSGPAGTSTAVPPLLPPLPLCRQRHVCVRESRYFPAQSGARHAIFNLNDTTITPGGLDRAGRSRGLGTPDRPTLRPRDESWEVASAVAIQAAARGVISRQNSRVRTSANSRRILGEFSANFGSVCAAEHATECGHSGRQLARRLAVQPPRPRGSARAAVSRTDRAVPGHRRPARLHARDQ